MNTSQAAHQSKSVLYPVAALSLIAGLIHVWVTPEHFEEWWGYGTFFLVAAAAQVVYVPLLLRWPTRMVLILGIAGNSAIVLLYLLTRVVGIPLFGPEAGDVEEAQRCSRPHIMVRILRYLSKLLWIPRAYSFSAAWSPSRQSWIARAARSPDFRAR